MDSLFQSRFGALMEGISGQFGATPLGVALFLLALISLPLLLTIFYRIQRGRQRREQLERSRGIIAKREEKLGLSPAERALVERLVDADEESERAYLVLFDEPRFHAAAKRLLQSPGAPATSSIAALRVKLGFRREPAKSPRSTAMIPEGSSLLLKPEKGEGVLKAEVTRILPDGFEILIRGTARLVPGDSALFQYQNSRGTFLFRSYCIRRAEGKHLIRHTEKLKQRQQRAWFRNPWSGPVSVGFFDKEERYDPRFVDLGGGGASLVNPEGRFREGDFLEISFTPPGESATLNLRGRVMRSSRNNGRLHLMFEGINESQRDRILGGLFKPGAESE